MAHVIQTQSRTPQILSDLMATFHQNQAIDAQRAMQEKQLGIQQGELADTQKRTGLMESQQTSAQAQARAKAFMDYQVPALKNDPAALAKAASEFMKADPEAGKLLVAYAQGRPTTPEDTAQLGSQQFKASKVAAANAGSQDVQALDVTRQVAGTPFSKEGLADQQQRQGPDVLGKLPPAYGQTLAIEGQRAPSAGQSLASSTQKSINAANIAAEAPVRKAQVANFNAQAQKAMIGTGATKDDATAIADAIVRGDQPPDLKGLYRQGAAVRAELARRGYDLTKATQDWKSTEKYLSTINGTQQVRLRQAVDFANESLGVVEDLGKQWEGGGFPLLNKGRLEAAKQGALGPQAQALATKLDSQIVEMQSELAVVYRGGNSPTDEALKGAGKVLQANWSWPTLQANVNLIRKNLVIRRNSMNSAGVVTNSDNEYAPKTGAPEAPKGKTGDPLGILGP